MSAQDSKLIPLHGGYRNLKTFRLAQLVYDVTVRFCDRYMDRRSRTRDQMVQAARSDVQNIAGGSQVSGTSRKMELKLTNVARASLEELRLDYQDYLRQSGFTEWPQEHPALKRFRAKRCATLDQFRAWVFDERKRGRGELGRAPAPDPVRARPCSSVPSAQLVANAALSLPNLTCHLLDWQLAAQAGSFLTNGGFTERIYRIGSSRRQNPGC